MKLFKSACFVVTLVILSGCSAYMAAKQPDKIDLSVLKEGTNRYAVLAELGAPIASDEKNGTKQDIYKFTQGYSTTNKTSRAIGHGLATVATLGLWEVIGTPIEGANDGKEIQLMIEYDMNEKIKDVTYIKGENVENKSTQPNKPYSNQ